MAAAVRSRSPSSRSSSPERSDSSVIVLFAPPIQPQSALTPHHHLTHPPSTSLSSTSSSSRSSGPPSPPASPPTLSHSLFPSHDGNGRFTTESLLLSESDAAAGSPSDDSSAPSHLSSSHSRATRRFPSADRSTSGSDSFDYISSAAEDREDTLGGSWALTEEALSALPDADSPIALGASHRTRPRRPSSAADTEGSSSAERDEDELSTTPHAASAGLGWRTWRTKGRVVEDSSESRSREAYPSPSPAGRRMKRRHRMSGKGVGSQKRSSTSGSVRGNKTPHAVPVVGPTTPTAKDQAAGRIKEDQPSSPGRRGEVFFRKLVARLVDSDTMDLLVADDNSADSYLPTPAPSRATSPDPIATPHGPEALSSYARAELDLMGFGAFAAMDAVDEQSGDETETETERWTASPGQQHRSLSLTSLPSYLLSPLSASTTSSAATAKATPTLLRRTSSFAGALSVAGRDESSAWGGEMGGIEAAISYWRRIFSRMRGGHS